MSGEIDILSCSSTATNLTYSQDTHYVKVENIGNYTAYVDFNGSTATTQSYPIRSGDIIEVGVRSMSKLSAICNGTETTTLQINSAGEL